MAFLRKDRIEYATRVAAKLWSGQVVPLPESYDIKNQVFELVAQAGKGIVAVSKPRQGKETGGAKVFAYYPEKDDASKFASGNTERGGGPSDVAPGCVGIAELRPISETTTKLTLQASYYLKKHPAVDKPLAGKYRRWRSYLLEKVFEHAKAEGITGIVLRTTNKAGKLHHEIFAGVGKKHGWRALGEEEFKTTLVRG